MEAVKLWVRQISGFLILSVLIKNIFPDKEYEPYIRLFLNLLLVLLLIKPVTGISSEGINGRWTEASAQVSAGRSLEEELKELNEQQTRLEKKQQNIILGEKISRLLAAAGAELISIEAEYDEKSGLFSNIYVKVQPSYSEFTGIIENQEMDDEKYLEAYLNRELEVNCIHAEIMEADNEKRMGQ